MKITKYIITNCSDMAITDILPGRSKEVKKLLPKHIRYYNNGLLNIKTVITDSKEELKNQNKDLVKKEVNE